MAKTKEKAQITEGNILRCLINFTLPLMAGQFFQQLYTTTDAVIVGNFVKSNGLAAIGASNQLVNLLIGFFIGMTTGMGVIIAQGYGAKDDEKVSIGTHTSMFICIVGGIAVTIIGILSAPFVLKYMDTPADVMKDAIVYLQLYFAGAVFNIVYNMGASILRGVGDSKRPFIILLVSSVVNIALDCLFVIVFKWGIFGAGFATLIAQIVAAIIVVWILVTTNESYRVDFKKIKCDKRVFGQIMKLGAPSGLQNTIITISNMIVQTNINSFGKEAMAGVALYWRADNFLMIPMISMIMTATTFAGQNAGAGKIERIKKGLLQCQAIGLVYAVTVMLFMYNLSWLFLRIFTQEKNVLEYAIMQSRIICLGYISLAIFQVLLGFIRGLGESFMPMLISIANMCVLRIIYLNTFVSVHHEMKYVYWSYPLTWTTTMLCAVIYYVVKSKKLYGKYQFIKEN